MSMYQVIDISPIEQIRIVPDLDVSLLALVCVQEAWKRLTISWTDKITRQLNKESGSGALTHKYWLVGVRP